MAHLSPSVDRETPLLGTEQNGFFLNRLAHSFIRSKSRRWLLAVESWYTVTSMSCLCTGETVLRRGIAPACSYDRQCRRASSSWERPASQPILQTLLTSRQKVNTYTVLGWSVEKYFVDVADKGQPFLQRPAHHNHTTTTPQYISKCTVSVKKNPPLRFSDIFPKWLGIFSPNFTHLLNVPIYVRLQIFIQLPATLTKLCHFKRDRHHAQCAHHRPKHTLGGRT